jgi:hypothetical protein
MIPNLLGLYSPQAFARHLRSLSSAQVNQADEAYHHSLPAEYARLLREEARYRMWSFSRGGDRE